MKGTQVKRLCEEMGKQTLYFEGPKFYTKIQIQKHYKFDANSYISRIM